MKELREYSLDQYCEFIIEKLQGLPNIELLILQGHILSEHSLNMYLESLCHEERPTFFDTKDFTYHQKLLISRDFGTPGLMNQDLYQLLSCLNKVRNDIAHRLSYKVDHLKTLLWHYQKLKLRQTPYPINDDSLGMAICYVCGVLYGGAERLREKNK